MIDLEIYNKTRALNNLENRCVSFIKSEKYLKHLTPGIDADVWIVAPYSMSHIKGKYQSNIKFYFSENPKYDFTTIHNIIYQNYIPQPPVIGKDCVIHHTVVMDVDGMRMSRIGKGDWRQFIHTGNVVIEDQVEIGPYTVIHRGTFGSTMIKRDARIGAQNNIGHNTVVGEHTIITAGVITGGSSTIGDNCLLGMGSIVRNGVSVCDDVTIGMGAVVTKDINRPGTYIGNPARFVNKKYTSF